MLLNIFLSVYDLNINLAKTIWKRKFVDCLLTDDQAKSYLEYNAS